MAGLPEKKTEDAPQGPFPTYPGRFLIEQFLAHVKETGRPDTWEHHDPSKPPPESDFEEITRFAIAEKLRPEVGKATCPICSPHAGKYYEGALAWFPSEGILRAIGHECAKTHFGVQRANAAFAARIAREQRESAENYLLDTLPRISGLRAETEQIRSVAREMDQLRAALWRRAGKVHCARLSRIAANGFLEITEVVEIEKVDRFGRTIPDKEERVVQRFRVSGMSFLKAQPSTESKAQNALHALELVKALDQEAALHFVTEELHKDEYLFDAETLARQAAMAYETLLSLVSSAKAFTKPANLYALAEWSNDRRTRFPVHFVYDQGRPSQVQIRKTGARPTIVPIPPSLQNEL